MTFSAVPAAANVVEVAIAVARPSPEILTMNDTLREMVATHQPVTQIKEEARRHGTRYLREMALELVARGQTTLEEIGRVTLSA